jgi:hypothetical protein
MECPKRPLNGRYYAKGLVKKRKKEAMVMLHHFILGVRFPTVVDHKNRCTWDCTRDNLRIATKQQNTWNKSVQRNNSTGLKGVCYERDSPYQNKYRAKITYNGRRFYLGRFFTAEEAAIAYDNAARQYFGEFACLNYPSRPVNLPPPTPTYHKARKGKNRFTGVCWHASANKWEAYVSHNKKKTHIGLFESEEDAALARDVVAFELQGSKARLNFPLSSAAQSTCSSVSPLQQ